MPVLFSVKGVASILRPSFTAKRLASDSINWLTVIRLGIQCGLMIISGVSPEAVKGMSSCLMIKPHVPFWASLLANLSPTSGILTYLILICINGKPSGLLTIHTLSTVPWWGHLARILASLVLFWPSFVVKEANLPINTVFCPFTVEPTFITPYIADSGFVSKDPYQTILFLVSGGGRPISMRCPVPFFLTAWVVVL